MKLRHNLLLFRFWKRKYRAYLDGVLTFFLFCAVVGLLYWGAAVL
jgi:hypothetical protein